MAFQKVLVDKIRSKTLYNIAGVIQSYAYESPERNRFIGTPGLDKTMETIEQILDGSLPPITDYYNVSRHYFKYKYRGKVLNL